MIRLSKLSDYAIVVLTTMVRNSDAVSLSSACLSQKSSVPEPTVAKLMKLLAKGGVVTSHRGTSGGYMLARTARDISVADIIVAVEGPISLTECVGGHDDTGCHVERLCAVRGNWDRINTALVGALSGVSLAEMAEPFIPAAYRAETHGAKEMA
jgi:FeS assembly SUF system regulator